MYGRLHFKRRLHWNGQIMMIVATVSRLAIRPVAIIVLTRVEWTIAVLAESVQSSSPS